VKKCSVFFVLLIVLFISFLPAYANTVYVTNNLDIPLRSKESNKARIMSLLPIGTPVEVLGENSKTGFSHVQLIDGMQGFIATKNTMLEPPSHTQPGTMSKNLGALQTENNALKAEMAKIKASITPDTSLEQSLALERDRLDRELTEIKKSASNQIQIKDERDQLQEDVVNVKRDLEQLKLENNALKDGANQDWFLYGGFLSLAGVFLGFILPKLAWRRKNNWDRF
jgi:SH3 domain protein